MAEIDLGKPFSDDNIQDILNSGNSRTATGKAVQILLDKWNVVNGWDIYDIDQQNTVINLVESAFNQIAEVATGQESNIELPTIPNVAEFTARVIEDTARKEDGSTVQLPNSVKLLYNVDPDALGQDFFQNFGTFLSTDSTLDAIASGKLNLPPPEEQFSGGIFENVVEFFATPLENVGVAINQAVGGKAGEIVLNKVGFAQGVPFVGSFVNVIADALMPTSAQAWSDYLYRKGYIDSQGNEIKEFDPSSYDKIVSDFFRANPKAQMAEEQRTKQDLKNELLNAGYTDDQVQNLSYDSLRELSQYGESLGVTQELLDKGIDYRQMPIDVLYNKEPSQPVMDSFSNEDFEQLAENMRTKPPQDWVDGIEGVDAFNVHSFINAAEPYITDLIRQDYDGYGTEGYEEDIISYILWDNAQDVDGNYNNMDEIVLSALDKVADEYIAAKTGVFNPDGQGFGYNAYSLEDGTRFYGMDHNVGRAGHDYGGLVDYDGDGYVDSSQQGYQEGTYKSYQNTANVAYEAARDAVKESSGRRFIGQYDSGGYGSELMDQDYEAMYNELQRMAIAGEISADDFYQAATQLEQDFERMFDEYTYSSLVYKEPEEIIEEVGLDRAEQLLEQDLNGDGDIDGMPEQDYQDRKQFERDLQQFGDDNDDGIPDYPDSDGDGMADINPNTGMPYGMRADDPDQALEDYNNRPFDDGTTPYVPTQGGEAIYDINPETNKAVPKGEDFQTSSAFDKKWAQQFLQEGETMDAVGGPIYDRYAGPVDQYQDGDAYDFDNDGYLTDYELDAWMDADKAGERPTQRAEQEEAQAEFDAQQEEEDDIFTGDPADDPFSDPDIVDPDPVIPEPPPEPRWDPIPPPEPDPPGPTPGPGGGGGGGGGGSPIPAIPTTGDLVDNLVDDLGTQPVEQVPLTDDLKGTLESSVGGAKSGDVEFWVDTLDPRFEDSVREWHDQNFDAEGNYTGGEQEVEVTPLPEVVDDIPTPPVVGEEPEPEPEPTPEPEPQPEPQPEPEPEPERIYPLVGGPMDGNRVNTSTYETNPETLYDGKYKFDPDTNTYVYVEPEVVEPVVETPVVETPVVETPVVEEPVVETPPVETVVETPPIVGEEPEPEPPVETPVVETPPVVEEPEPQPGQGFVPQFDTDTSVIDQETEAGTFTPPVETEIEVVDPGIDPVSGRPVIATPITDALLQEQTPVTEAPVTTAPTETPEIFEGTEGGEVFDTGGTIEGSTGMAEGEVTEQTADDTSTGVLPEDTFDIGYQTALMLGAENPESYIGGGLPGVLDLVTQYEKEEARAALDVQREIAPEQQSLANQLRDEQRLSDLALMDKYGPAYSEQLRALSPERTRLLGETYDLAMQQFEDLDQPYSARELQQARSEAYAQAATKGRQYDPVAQLAVLNELQDIQGTREAQALGTSAQAFNMASSLDSPLNQFLLGGSQFAPTTVSPAFGGTGAVNLGLQSYANQQQAAYYDQAYTEAQRNYNAMVADPNANPSDIQRAANQLAELEQGLRVVQGGIELFKEAPAIIGGVSSAIGSVAGALSDVPIVGGFFGGVQNVAQGVSSFASPQSNQGTASSMLDDYLYGSAESYISSGGRSGGTSFSSASRRFP